jgi:hypothetical protein
VTFDDDFIKVGMIRPTLKSLGMEWPPPPFIEVNNHGELPNLFLKQISCSQITDEERSKMTRVCRGAEYQACSPSEVADYAMKIGAKHD